LNQLELTTFDVYLYIVQAKEPATPREIMNANDIKSPSVIQRHLQKLTKWGWIAEDTYGRYSAKKRVSFKGHFWVGNWLLSTSILGILGLIAMVAVTAVGLNYFLVPGQPPNVVFYLFIFAVVVICAYLLAETLQPQKKQPKDTLPTS
jgi:hypothetical protein